MVQNLDFNKRRSVLQMACNFFISAARLGNTDG